MITGVIRIEDPNTTQSLVGRQAFTRLRRTFRNCGAVFALRVVHHAPGVAIAEGAHFAVLSNETGPNYH